MYLQSLVDSLTVCPMPFHLVPTFVEWKKAHFYLFNLAHVVYIVF